jgi:phenylacetate-CoA ligase
MKIPYLPKEFHDPIKLDRMLKTKPESFWIRRGEKRALELFHQMAKRVPAYKDFLGKNGIKPNKIKNIADFKHLPTLDKDNYLRAYPREQLCWDGEYPKGQWVVSSTSGSTGEPYYFPRQSSQDWQYAVTAELYLRNNFHIQDRTTLYINAFPMGAWIGGVFTYEAIKLLADRGKYDLTIISPGIHKLEVIKALKNLGRDFDQVLIGAYAPFLKDILDEGTDQGLDWKSYKLGFIFSAEGFSETFRNHVIEETGIHELTGTLNHYGTVDLGTMSHETPLTILLRRMAVEDDQVYESLLGQIHRLPTLTQYIPELFYFEEVSGNLLCSAFSGIPLVRYDLKDHGGVIDLDEATRVMTELGVDLSDEIEKAGIKDTVWNLPMVHVYERSDFSVSFFAFQIYPETIRKVVHEDQFRKDLTGKFTMMVQYNKKSDQELIIHAELKKGRKETAALKKRLTSAIVKRLLKENSEYRETAKLYPEQTIPKIQFWPYEHDQHFKPGAKQKWVKKG